MSQWELSLSTLISEIAIDWLKADFKYQWVPNHKLAETYLIYHLNPRPSLRPVLRPTPRPRPKSKPNH